MGTAKDESIARRQGAVGLASMVCIGTIFLGSVYSSLPGNVLTVRRGNTLRATLSGVLPQGWSFFTKPPDSPEISPSAVRDDALVPASQFPNSRSDNLLGVSREQRSQGPEMAILGAAAREWLDCDDVDGDCRLAAAGSLDPTRVRNTSPTPTLCGKVLLAETVPVPWEFRYSYNGWRLDSRVTFLEITC